MPYKNDSAPIGVGQRTRLRLNTAPQPPATRVREPVRPTCGKVVGFYPSVKNKRQIAWESQLEKAACNLFEFSTTVISYREQPLKIHYPSLGTILQYTPDFELVMSERDGVRPYI